MPKTVLVVDDEERLVSLVKAYLEQAGFRVVTANNGRNALFVARQEKPDLILLDVMMPRISGFETCRRLKENPETQEVPVIFMTALTETEHKITGFEAGAVDYVTKPLQHKEVLARVKTHLMLQRLRLYLGQTASPRRPIPR